MVTKRTSAAEVVGSEALFFAPTNESMGTVSQTGAVLIYNPIYWVKSVSIVSVITIVPTRPNKG